MVGVCHIWEHLRKPSVHHVKHSPDDCLRAPPHTWKQQGALSAANWRCRFVILYQWLCDTCISKMSSKSHTATPPTVHIAPKLDICCALFLLPLAMSLKSHTHSSSELQTESLWGWKKSSGTFLMVRCTHIYTHTLVPHTNTRCADSCSEARYNALIPENSSLIDILFSVLCAPAECCWNRGKVRISELRSALLT